MRLDTHRSHHSNNTNIVSPHAHHTSISSATLRTVFERNDPVESKMQWITHVSDIIPKARLSDSLEPLQ